MSGVNGKYNPILKSLVFFWTDDKNKRINTLKDFTTEFFNRTALTEMIDKFMKIAYCICDPNVLI